MEWVQDINKSYGTNITATRVYDYPSIREFAKYLREERLKVPHNGATKSAGELSFDDVLQRVQRGELDAEAASQLLGRQ